jgi:exosortase/archaeosortase family protein
MFKTSSFNAAVAPLLLLVLPLFEFISLRLYLHDVLNIRIGYRGMTDYDWLFPSLIAFFLLMFLLQKTEKATLSFRRGALCINALLFAAFVAISFFGLPNPILENLFLKTAWFLLAVATLLTSCFAFISPRYFFLHSDRVLLIPFFLLASCKLIGRHLFSFLWQPMADLTSYIAYECLNLVLPNLTLTPFLGTDGAKYMHLTHPLYTLAIGSGCGGMEGISFILFAILLSYFMDHRRFSSGQWSLMIVSSAIWMYSVNLLRIFFFYLVTLATLSVAGHDGGMSFALTVFHNWLGWVLYTAALVVFYHEFYALVDRAAVKVPSLSKFQAT